MSLKTITSTSDAQIVGPQSSTITSDAIIGSVAINQITITSDAMMLLLTPPGQTAPFPPPAPVIDLTAPLVIECPRATPCLQDIPPYTNLSSELPDAAYFTNRRGINIGQNWGDPQTPPLIGGNPWLSWNCYTECDTLTNQLDADICAYDQQMFCLFNPDNPPTPPPINPKTNQPYTLVPNQPQTASFTCPDGSFSYWTIPFGYIFTLSLAQSNKIALSLAKKILGDGHICLNDLPPYACGGPSTYEIKATGNHPPFTFELINGDVPDGTVLFPKDDTTVLLDGSFTTPGAFSFTIKATDAKGYYNIKTYNINVLSITANGQFPNGTVGVAYSYQIPVLGGTAPYQYKIVNGFLPNGLSMSSTGLITGVPVSEETEEILLQVTDDTGVVCNSGCTIMINKAPDNCGSTLESLNCPLAKQYMLDVLAYDLIQPVPNGNLNHICSGVFNKVGVGFWVSPTDTPDVYCTLDDLGNLNINYYAQDLFARFALSGGTTGCPIGTYLPYHIINFVSYPLVVTG